MAQWLADVRMRGSLKRLKRTNGNGPERVSPVPVQMWVGGGGGVGGEPSPGADVEAVRAAPRCTRYLPEPFTFYHVFARAVLWRTRCRAVPCRAGVTDKDVEDELKVHRQQRQREQVVDAEPCLRSSSSCLAP